MDLAVAILHLFDSVRSQTSLSGKLWPTGNSSRHVVNNILPLTNAYRGTHRNQVLHVEVIHFAVDSHLVLVRPFA